MPSPSGLGAKGAEQRQALTGGLPRRRRVKFVLVRPRNPNNIGASARAMANFGWDDLTVVDPYPEVWRESRSAVGAASVLRRAKSLPLAEALQGASLVLGTCGAARRLLRPVVPLPALADYIERRVPRAGRLAVLFGNEKTGLSREHLEHCHALVRIPTDAGVPSMNLGQAVALVAYELARVGLSGHPLDGPRLEPAPNEQAEALMREFLRVFEVLDYMQGLPATERTRRVREALKRLSPSRKDAGLLLAVLRRIGEPRPA